jgi:hypothetical protein
VCLCCTSSGTHVRVGLGRDVCLFVLHIIWHARESWAETCVLVLHIIWHARESWVGQRRVLVLHIIWHARESWAETCMI